MNYRDFFKNKTGAGKDIQSLIPEGIDQKEFNRAVTIENRQLNDKFIAARIVRKNLREDANYYKKLHGIDEHCGACEDDFDGIEEPGNEYDDNDGLPKVGGALAVPHIGQPIMMGKIVQVGGEFKDGQSASGELSGMTNSSGRGVAKDQGGLPVQQENDSETITAGGKKVDSSIASKSVGGPVTPGEGQKQGGKNSVGTIASTSKLIEIKNKVRNAVKEILKEIKFDKKTGKWVKINEEVNMKMGAAYKTVQPRQYKVSDDDFARKNQYEPEITEMYDDEEECMMNERYVELANEQRNLSEAELTELKTLREKIDRLAEKKSNVKEGRCEDYPCCGHGDGGCPNSDGSFNCAFCGGKLPKNARSSMCSRCQRRMNDLDRDDPTGQDSESEFGGEYQMEEMVDMKMGPAYKTVQPTLAKTSDDDFARQNQYDPEISEDENLEEAGGGATQHSSYRTIPNGNLPQDSKTRWKNDVDEGLSKVSKSIQKGNKPKKSTNIQNLKHKKPKKISTGVHKRKT